jgi:hypothetical protein
MLRIIAITSTEWLVAWFADWGLQNSWQANNKRQNWAIAVIHSFIYSTAFLFFYLWNPYNPLDTGDILKWLLIWWTHAIIDRLNGGAAWVRLYNWDWSDWKTGKPSAPLFVALSLDQMQHHLINIAILTWGEDWPTFLQLLS